MFDYFKKVSAFVFDVDGVLTNGQVLVNEAGEQLRNFDIKDGYAIQAAILAGYPIAIISGGTSEGVKKRLNGLGIIDIHTGVQDKPRILSEWISTQNLNPDQVLYMGDDIPDLKSMQSVGVPVCPTDAVEEIKQCAVYISPKKGGNGAVRDVIEKTMKLQGKWPE